MEDALGLPSPQQLAAKGEEEGEGEGEGERGGEGERQGEEGDENKEVETLAKMSESKREVTDRHRVSASVHFQRHWRTGLIPLPPNPWLVPVPVQRVPRWNRNLPETKARLQPLQLEVSLVFSLALLLQWSRE